MPAPPRSLSIPAMGTQHTLRMPPRVTLDRESLSGGSTLGPSGRILLGIDERVGAGMAPRVTVMERARRVSKRGTGRSGRQRSARREPANASIKLVRPKDEVMSGNPPLAVDSQPVRGRAETDTQIHLLRNREVVAARTEHPPAAR
jgi:hypothetical protein